MSAIGKILLSPAVALAKEVGLIKKPKPAAAAAAAIPVARPQPVARNTAVLDAVASRQGSRANQRTGAGGAEPGAAGKKTQLGA